MHPIRLAGADRIWGDFGGETFVFGAGDHGLHFNATPGDQIAFDARPGLDLADVTGPIGANVSTIAHAGNTLNVDCVPRLDLV
jgi:hypothetical protein